jgi:hypothetical protein
MYKARIEKLHKNGVITDEEYDSLVDVGFDNNGKLKPGVYKGNINTRYCLGFEPGKENLIEAVKIQNLGLEQRVITQNYLVHTAWAFMAFVTIGTGGLWII